MSKFLDWVEIKNFKSIKQTRFDCKRVNVLIGKPNVGKSNILEALGLLNGNIRLFPNSDILSQDIVRFEKITQLFFKGYTHKKIEILTNKGQSTLSRPHHKSHSIFEYFSGPNDIVNDSPKDLINSDIDFNQEELQVIQKTYQEKIKKYQRFEEDEIADSYSIFDDTGKIIYTTFRWNAIRPYRYKYRQLDKFEVSGYLELKPPVGENLFYIIDSNQTLRKEIIAIFKEYGLQFVLSKNDSKFYIQHNEDGYVYQYPYSSIADTFQRYIFYLAAIASNNDAVLIFEEPEVHSFPPFVRDLALKMVEKDNNQYFVSTHSPYLLQTLISELDDSELNICLTYYKDYQTQVKVLSAAEVQDIRDFGYDVFFNLNKFEPND